jgi:hypothetical protein
MAQVILTKEESEEYFLNALCNGLFYFGGYGLDVECDDAEYKAAKDKLSAPCYEDVWMQVLRDGGKLTAVDIEGDGDMTRSITLKEVHERVQLTPFHHLQAMIEECDDAETADVILQTVFFEDIIFG